MLAPPSNRSSRSTSPWSSRARRSSTAATRSAVATPTVPTPSVARAPPAMVGSTSTAFTSTTGSERPHQSQSMRAHVLRGPSHLRPGKLGWSILDRVRGPFVAACEVSSCDLNRLTARAQGSSGSWAPPSHWLGMYRGRWQPMPLLRACWRARRRVIAIGGWSVTIARARASPPGWVTSITTQSARPPSLPPPEHPLPLPERLPPPERPPLPERLPLRELPPPQELLPPQKLPHPMERPPPPACPRPSRPRRPARHRRAVHHRRAKCRRE